MELGILDLTSQLDSIEIAPAVEAMGYTRYWLSEHHEHDQADGVNPTLMTALVAGVTKRMRVGPAGVLLTYYSPYKVAEDFRLLQHFFAGRLDLGIARAPANAEIAAALLDGRSASNAEDFERRARDLAGYLYDRKGPEDGPVPLIAKPRLPENTTPPIMWILGTSGGGAKFAGALGAAYSYSAFYAPNPMEGIRAIDAYRESFRPSAELSAPLWNVHVGGFCLDTQAEVVAIENRWRKLHNSFYGTPEAWHELIAATSTRYQTNEIIVSSLFRENPAAQIHSYGLIAGAS